MLSSSNKSIMNFFFCLKWIKTNFKETTYASSSFKQWRQSLSKYWAVFLYAVFNTSSLRTFKWHHFIPLDTAWRTDWGQVIFSKRTNSMRNGHITGEAHAQALCEMGCHAGIPELSRKPWEAAECHLPGSTVLTPLLLCSLQPGPWHSSFSAIPEDAFASNYCFFPSSLPADLCTHAPSGTSVKASWVSFNI